MAAVNITKNEFQNYVAEGKGLVLADFWAPWCTYCRRIGPAFDKIADQYREELAAVKINVDEEPELAQRYQVEVIPTLVLFRDGRPVGTVVAPDSKAAIETFIKEHRNKG